ncbi:uncharacterized protein LAESUDRAFT_812305 [Laetiporus sulphureus 93-53]|uniref:F-box domain-containing protein n=1 Tax=Laetiporus sulphureus 93-53 TaxID=1314785 RepID=A0A165ELR4_9APHY|nr:uncharacterized protein LAESUDRAFT_812305 [Laetiporus sulphureus 93-53]KZT07320.1 hypothetical protein LAESUDRAFT_812305 [Laetiporus sulphureus 93-53]
MEPVMELEVEPEVEAVVEPEVELEVEPVVEPEVEPVANREVELELPIEVWENVINHLWDDQRALRRCMLVCRAWYPPSLFHLRRLIRIKTVKTVMAYAKKLKRRPELSKRPYDMTIVGKYQETDLSALSTAAIMLARKLPRLERLTIQNSEWKLSTMHGDIFLHLSAFSVTRLHLHIVMFPSITVLARLDSKAVSGSLRGPGEEQLDKLASRFQHRMQRFSLAEYTSIYTISPGPVEWDQVYEHISVIFRADFIYQPHVAQARFILYRYQVIIDYYERLEYQPHRIVREFPRPRQPVEDDQELYHLLFDEEYGISSDEEEPF